VHHTRIVAALAATATTVVLSATLVGCSSAAGSELTLPTAKQQTIAVEKQIVAYVPADQVTGTDITDKSRVIFPCIGKSGQSYWPGSTTLKLKNDVDTDAVLTAIAAHWTNKSGWSAYTNTGSDGNKSLAIKSDSGYSFTVEFDQGPVFSINALSGCFASAGLSGKSNY
jgi:hypothetical protein